jgi:hypothetical protein
VTLDPSEVKAIDSAWFWRPVKLKMRGRVDWYMQRLRMSIGTDH